MQAFYFCDVVMRCLMLCIARTMPSHDVCLSLRLSVTRRYFVEAAQHIIKLFDRRVATPLLVFAVPNVMAILRRARRRSV